MNNKKQKLLLEYLLSSADTFSLCHGIIKSTYFDPEYRNTVSFIFEYFEQYHTTPTPIQVEAETNVKLEAYDILDPDQIDYCSTEVETFCKRRALEEATLALPGIIEKGDYGKAEEIIKEAVLVSLNKNLGLRYFETVDERLQRNLTEDATIATGFNDLDDALFGGPSRKNLLLVSANSGGGKSITLANIGRNCVERGLNVLYISLELDEDTVSQRYDTMFTGIGRKIWKENIPEISTKIKSLKKECGVLDVIQMDTGTSANKIRSFLKEYTLHHGFKPDVLIVDYLDEMSPNETVSADNVWEKDKRCASQLRQIGVDYNLLVATASQLNRSAVKATAGEHDHSQIAGGISKINIADVYWSIIMTEDMRIAGEIVFILQKTRNSDGVGKQFHMKWDNKFLRISDHKKSGLKLNKKIAPPTDTLSKSKLDQLIEM